MAIAASGEYKLEKLRKEDSPGSAGRGNPGRS